MRTLPVGFVVATLALAPAPQAAAQSALATDLWRVAEGTLVVPAALASDGSSAFWTPAYALGGAGPGARVGVETIHASADAGVGATIATVSLHPRGAYTVNFVYGRASVSDLVRTETSPEAIGTIPAYAQVLSLGAARTFAADALTIGVAARALSGQLDDRSSTRWAVDVGASYSDRHFRLGAATRFFDPTSASSASGACYSLAAEYRTPEWGLWGAPATFRARYGLGLARGEGPSHLATAGVLLARVLEFDAGAAREETDGTAVWRSRMGAAVSAGRYRVYIARDGGVNGFDPTYRFGLAATLR